MWFSRKYEVTLRRKYKYSIKYIVFMRINYTLV